MIRRFAILLCILVSVTNSHAAPINLDFQAEVSDIDDPNNVLGNVLGLSVELGDAVFAGYSMESNPAFVTDISSSVGTFYTAQTAISTYADFGNVVLNASGARSPNLLVSDNVFFTQTNTVADSWRIFVDLIPPGGSQPNIWMGVALADSTTTRLSNEEFFVNSSFDGWDRAIFFIRDEQNLLLRAQYDFAPVPIPAAFWLFGSGLVGLMGVARRKKS